MSSSRKKPGRPPPLVTLRRETLLTGEQLSAATRFFAQVEQAVLACPACGIVTQIRRMSRARRLRGQLIDPATGRWQCGNCRRWFLPGLLLWPVIDGYQRRQVKQPADQVPTLRELAQLRRLSDGIWMEELQGTTPQITNLIGEPEEEPEEEIR